MDGGEIMWTGSITMDVLLAFAISLACIEGLKILS